MSWQAMAWATKAGKDYELSPTVRLALWALANYADPEGNDIFPSINTLSDDTGLSESTVRRSIKHLCDVGIMAMGDQRAVDRIPANKRPTVYRFLYQGRKGCHSGTSRVTPLEGLGVSLKSVGGVSGGVTVTPKPVKTKEEPRALCRECSVSTLTRLLTESGLCPDCIPAPTGQSVEMGSGHAQVLAMLAERRAKRGNESPSTQALKQRS